MSMKSVNISCRPTCRICGKVDGKLLNILEKKYEEYLNQIHRFLKVEVSFQTAEFRKGK